MLCSQQIASNTIMKIGIITNCLDLMAGINHRPKNEYIAVFNSVIDELGSYPKPAAQNKNILSAYLLASNVRNACKLAKFKVLALVDAVNVVQVNLEACLSLLLDLDTSI